MGSKFIHTFDVWLKTFAIPPAAHPLMDSLASFGVSLKPWSPAAREEFGLVLLQDIDRYDQLISFLNVQQKYKGHRIIVVNLDLRPLEPARALHLYQYGAEYYYEWSVIAGCPEAIGQKLLRWRSVDSIIRSPVVRQHVVGNSQRMREALRYVVEVAVYSNASLLITGERGTGKEQIAKVVHALDTRRGKGQFVVVDCTTVHRELSGSELFGHEKGAFTGAESARDGAFALADNGTLFLDEIGELPPQIQAELLRITQDKTYKRVGGNAWKQADFRLIGATNRSLETEVELGNFREDLLDRLSLCTCHLPPLRERKEDIPLLVEHFLRQQCKERPEMGAAVYDFLQSRAYPGNVRELQHLVKRMMLRWSGAGPLTFGDIPASDRQHTHAIPLEKWHEQSGFAEAIQAAVESGCDLRQIAEVVKDTAMQIALSLGENNKHVSRILGKSERWVQLHRAKEK
ncbi:sigma 54-interacting transcriptional regulator [Chitinophaga lutea]